jgi:hypothetical protein
MSDQWMINGVRIEVDQELAHCRKTVLSLREQVLDAERILREVLDRKLKEVSIGKQA